MRVQKERKKGEEKGGKEKKILPLKNALDLRLYIYIPLSFFGLFNSILRFKHYMLDRRGKIKHY